MSAHDPSVPVEEPLIDSSHIWLDPVLSALKLTLDSTDPRTLGEQDAPILAQLTAASPSLAALIIDKTGALCGTKGQLAFLLRTNRIKSPVRHIIVAQTEYEFGRAWDVIERLPSHPLVGPFLRTLVVPSSLGPYADMIQTRVVDTPLAFPELRSLNLDSHKLQGLTTFSALTALNLHDAFNKSITDELILTALSTCRNLVHFSLSAPVTGSFLSNLPHLPSSLTSLHLYSVGETKDRTFHFDKVSLLTNLQSLSLHLRIFPNIPTSTLLSLSKLTQLSVFCDFPFALDSKNHTAFPPVKNLSLSSIDLDSSALSTLLCFAPKLCSVKLERCTLTEDSSVLLNDFAELCSASLTSLVLEDPVNFPSNLPFISKLSGLQFLSITGSAMLLHEDLIDSYDDLEEDEDHLRSLSCECFASLSSLRSLSIRRLYDPSSLFEDYRGLTNLHLISSLTNLTSLKVRDCWIEPKNEFHQLTTFSSLRRLRSFVFKRNLKLTHSNNRVFSQLFPHLTRLTELSLSCRKLDTDLVRPAVYLEHLLPLAPCLRSLKLGSIYLKDLRRSSLLSLCSELRTLSLRIVFKADQVGSYFGWADLADFLSDLAALPHLQSVRIINLNEALSLSEELLIAQAKSEWFPRAALVERLDPLLKQANERRDEPLYPSLGLNCDYTQPDPEWDDDDAPGEDWEDESDEEDMS